MVACFRRFLLPVLICGIFSLNGCNNDIFGLFGSGDMNDRWEARDTTHSLRSLLALGDEYSFVLLADTHLEGRDIPKLDKLRAYVANEKEKVKFVVFNGDITQNGKRKDVERFIRNADTLGVPWYPVVGNHDVFFGNWSVWKELIGPTCYRIDGDSATLLMLDSANGYFGSRQLDWLEDQLKRNTGRVFIFTHANLFVQSPLPVDHFTDVRERARFVSMVKGRCEVVFMGHLHRRVVNSLGGVQYVTTEDYLRTTTICHVSVTKDSIRWKFVKL